MTAFLLELPPNQATLMHRHDRDIASVFVNGGRTIGTFEGREPVLDTFPRGDVRYRTAGFTHATRNVGSQVFRSVILEFHASQGPAERPPRASSEDCSGTPSACVERLFCTTEICVARVSVAPGAIWRAPDNDQLIVAVSDLELADAERVPGTRRLSSGAVAPAAAGDAHLWRNVGAHRAVFVNVTFR